MGARPGRAGARTGGDDPHPSYAVPRPHRTGEGGAAEARQIGSRWPDADGGVGVT